MFDSFFPRISEPTKASVAKIIKISPIGEKDKPVVKISLPIITPIPKNPSNPPTKSFFVSVSLRKIFANRRVKIGIDAAIIPALRAVVSLIPKKKNEILKVTAKSPYQTRRGISFLAIRSLSLTKGRRKKEAAKKRINAREKTGTVRSVIFMTELLRPQTLEARKSARKGRRCLLVIWQ